MSLTPDPNHTNANSPSQTVVDLNGSQQLDKSLSPPSTLPKGTQPPSLNPAPTTTASPEPTIAPSKAEKAEPDVADSAWTELSTARKYGLLLVFATAISLDVFQASCFLSATESIARDLKLVAGNNTWIITAYSMTFASFLLFSGRLSDLLPAQIVFEVGFIGLGIFTLVSSFVTNKYGHLVLRAFTGIAGALTIPSAYHLTVHVFTDKTEQQGAVAMLGLSGAVSNSIGVVIGGLFLIGKSNWRWLYRFLAILAFVGSISGALLLPQTPTHKTHSDRSFLRRLDVPGVFLLTSSLLLFILGLTSGTVDGWSDAHFIAPFVLSVVLFVAFFFWEAKLDPVDALMPHEYWRLPNLKILVLTALSPYLVWAPSQFGFSNYWQVVLHMSPVLVGARLLPQGITGIIGGGLLSGIPVLLAKPKWTILAGLTLSLAGYVLQIYSHGGAGLDYWRYVFPGFILASGGAICTYLSLNVAIVQALPPSASGVAGALLQTTLQIGAVIALSVQAGLYSQVDNDLSDWHGSQYGFWFMFAWVAITAIAFFFFFKPQENTAAEMQAMQAIEADVKKEQEPMRGT